MRGFRCIVAVVLAFVLAASAPVHGARAAGMAMATAWSTEAAAHCDLCGGGAAVEAAAQCAFACAGLSGVIGDPVRLLDDCCDTPTAIATAARAGRPLRNPIRRDDAVAPPRAAPAAQRQLIRHYRISIRRVAAMATAGAT